MTATFEINTISIISSFKTYYTQCFLIQGAKKIEALCLHGLGSSYIAEQFRELTNLRYLQANGANFTRNFQNLLSQLRWLEWKYCLSDFAAPNFHPKKLVVLNLPYSTISEDWEGWNPLKVRYRDRLLLVNSHVLSC